MRLLYADESGDTGPFLQGTRSTTPIFVLGGVAIDARRIAELTQRYLQLAAKFNMCRAGPSTLWLDRIRLLETDGQKLRRALRSDDRAEARRARTYVMATLDLLERMEGSIHARIIVKRVDGELSHGVYPGLLLGLCGSFHAELTRLGVGGLVVLDSRDDGANADVVHSVFTQKHKASGGDGFPSILEVPLFGKPANHAGLQLADLMVSGILFPLASHAYARAFAPGPHTHGGFGILRGLLADRVLAFAGSVRVKLDPTSDWSVPRGFRLGDADHQAQRTSGP